MSGLEFTNVPVEFSKGLDTRTSPKLVVPGQWTSLVNCTAADDGTLTKRPGHQRMSWTLGSETGHGLAEFDDQLLTIRGHVVKSITAPSNVWAAAAAVTVPGTLPYLHVRRSTVARSTDFASAPDCAVGAGQEVYAWVTHDSAGAVTGISCVAIDSVTGTQLTSPQVVVASAFAATPRVVWDGAAFVILYIGAAGLLTGRVLMPGPGQLLGVTSWPAGPSVYGTMIDACSFGAGVTAVSYRSNDATYSVWTIQVVRVGALLNLGTVVPLFTQAQIPHTNVMAVGIGKMGANYCGTFIYAPPAGLGYTMEGICGINVNAAWAPCLPTQLVPPPATGNFSFSHVVCTDSDLPGLTAACVCADVMGDYHGVLGVSGVKPLRRVYVAPADPGANQIVLAGSGVIVNSCVYTPVPVAAVPPQGPFIAGKPVITGPMVAGASPLNGVGVVTLPTRMVPDAVAAQSGVFFLDVANGAVVGKAMYGRIDRFRGTETSVPSTHYVGPWLDADEPRRPDVNTFALPVLEAGRLKFEDGANTTEPGVSVLRVTPNSPMGTSEAGAFAPSSVQLGRATHLANGMLAMFDGERIVESGWNMYPEGLALRQTGAGGTWPVGVHQLVALYEWVDAQGQRHQSAPSAPVAINVLVANSVVHVDTPTLMLTQRAGVRHVVYSTLANGTIFYRLTGVIPNNQAVALSTTTFTAPPSAANELLYSQPFQAGTTLPNVAPGPCSTVAVHQDRLWVDLTDQTDAIRYSQQWVEGEGLQWNEALELSLPTEAGNVSRIVSMDDLLAILTQSRLYRVVGSGPTPNGANNGYSTAVEIPSDVGASNGRAVVRMPTGIVFLTAKGWYQLTRDLSVRYVGEAVKGFDRDSFTSAVMAPDRQELRIGSSASLFPGYYTAGAPGLKGAVQLCYSYVADAWSMFPVLAPTVTGQDWLRTHDARWWGAAGRYVSISLWDGVSWDAPGSYLDQPGLMLTGLSVGMSARTGFLRVAGIGGFQRVRWLYLTMSAPATPATSFTIAVDYDDTYQAVLPPGQPGAYVTTPVNMATVPWTSLAAIDVRHKLHRQKCKSVAFTIAELPSLGAGVTGMQAMTLVVGLKSGANRLPAAQGVG